MKVILFFALLCGNISLIAQTREFPWAIGVYGVKSEYLGDMRYRWANVVTDKPANTVLDFTPFYGGAALSVDRYLNRFFDAGLYVSASTFGYSRNLGKDLVAYSESINNFKVSPLLNANIHTRIKFLGQDNAIVVPYLVLGAGALNYQSFSTNTHTTRTDLQYYTAVSYNYREEKSDKFPAYAGILSGGVGVEFKLSKHFGIRYQAETGWTTSDNNDLYTARKGNDWQLQHSLGITYNFGKKTVKPKKTIEQFVETQQPVVKPVKEELITVVEPVELVKEEPKKEKTVVNNLLFELNKSELTNATKVVLNEKMPELREEVSIFIKGHTDSTGSETYNQTLSLQRANAVKNYLITNGISREKITVQGFGETQPIAPNDTKDGRAKNRRVEFAFGE